MWVDPMNLLSPQRQNAVISALAEGFSIRAVERLPTLGVTNHIWSISELIEAASMGALPDPVGRKVGRFNVCVIEGDRQ